MAPTPSQEIDVWQLREWFNEGGYLEKVRSGEYSARVKRNGHPSPEKSGQPYCTKSQIIEVLDQAGCRVAKFHQYLRPDGTIGASGMPDPKALFINGVLYYPPPKADSQDSE